MGNWISSITQWATRSQSLENPAVSLTTGSYGELYGPSASVYVTHDTALTLTAFRCGVDVISGQVARFRFSLYKENDDNSTQILRNHPIHRLVNFRPNPYQSRNKFFRALMYHALVAGNAYALIVRNKAGLPLELHLLNPFKVTFHTRKVIVGGESTRQDYYVCDGQEYLAIDVIHIAGISFDGFTGDNPINQARQSLALSLNAEAFGVSFYENGCSPSSYYEVANMPKDEKQHQQLRKTIEDLHKGSKNGNKVAVVPPGVKWTQTGVDPSKAQANETRQAQILEVCRLLNIPPHKLMDFSRATFSNIEATNREFITGTVSPWIEAIADEFNLKLIALKDQDSLYVDVKYSDALFGDSAAQLNYYKGMVDSGLMSRNECRAEKGLNRIPGGDKITVQLNLTTLDKIGEDVSPAPSSQSVPEVSQERDELPNSVPDPEVKEAVRGVLLEVLSRMVRRETAQVRKALGKRDPQGALEGVYRAHSAILTQSLTPAVTAWNRVAGDSVDAEELSARIISESREQLASNENIDDLLLDWEVNRAKSIVEGF